MGKRYDPRGYRKTKSTIEKIFFSAPEFIIYETQLGSWIVTQLQKTLRKMNKYSTDKIPKTSDTRLRKIMEKTTDILSNLLSWMNFFIEKKDMEKKKTN
jgi:hypothetical protein